MICLQKPLVLVTLIIACMGAGCIQDKQFKHPSTVVPEQLADGLQVGTPDSVGLSTDSLNKIYASFVDEGQYYNALCLLVLKDHKLVFETYCRSPDDRDHYSHVMSVTKSFTSMVFGIIKSQGLIDSVDQTLCTILPAACPSDSLKRTITLRHLLTMTSGLQFDNGEFSTETMVEKPSHQDQYILAKPLYAAPGDSFYYRDADPQLISYVIQKVSNRTELDLADQYIFKPMGITDYYWDSNPDGVTTGAFGLHLRARDMAKVGLMLLDNGVWAGTRIVDSSWIADATKEHLHAVEPCDADSVSYGYYFWIIPRYKAYSAWGHGGQYIFVQPETRLVVVMQSMFDVNDEKVGTRLDDFIRLIKPILGP